MKHVYMIVFLVLVWCGLNNSFSYVNLASGLVIAIICSCLFAIPRGQAVGRINIFYLPKLILFVLYELVVSSMQVAWEVITPRFQSQDKIIAVPLQCRGVLAETVLGNLVSLTPGTLCIDIDDKRVMLVHAMFAKNPDKVVHFIQHQLEPLVIKVFEYESN